MMETVKINGSFDIKWVTFLKSVERLFLYFFRISFCSVNHIFFLFLSKVTIYRNFSCSPTYKNIQNFHSMKLGKLETFSDVYFPICRLKHEKIRQRKTAARFFQRVVGTEKVKNCKRYSAYEHKASEVHSEEAFKGVSGTTANICD